MTVNRYFNENRNPQEQNLTEDIIIEAIQVTGQDLFYLPRDVINMDSLLNEDRSQFDSFKIIEMYVNDPEDYGNNEFNIGYGGMPLSRSIDFIVSKKRFRQETSMVLPREGDLLYSKYANTLWQIDFVNHEVSPIYQLSKNYVFQLSCSPFTFNDETFNTGIDSLDSDIAALEDPFARNGIINDEATDILDFDPDDPFQDNLVD